ncbi:hypothetical protein [Glaciibacter sp. 2TAF33]|uniref:hypothetical protein n=1 Tax=Glaciibacter sp. 2TAF33 TaxID=3233015 RepID=UPI003F8E4945
MPDDRDPSLGGPDADQPDADGLDWLRSHLDADADSDSGADPEADSDSDSDEQGAAAVTADALPSVPGGPPAPGSPGAGATARDEGLPDAPVRDATAPDAPASGAPASGATTPGETVPEPAPVRATPAPRIRDEIDLEPAPWWTTPVQKPLVPTDDEASRLLPTPATAADAATIPAPLVVAGGVDDAHAASAEGIRADQVGTGTNDVDGTGAVPRRTRRGGPAATANGSGDGRNPSRPIRTLIWIAAGVLAIVILVGLFFLGQQLGGAPAPAPTPTPTQTTPTQTPTPTPTPEAVGPRPAGLHKWDTLGGGECVQPYSSPWEEEFTVVDCAGPHAAQLVYRGTFAGDATTVFPGEAALAAQINLLCSAPGIIDLAAAAGYPDLQLQGSYPVTAEQWTSGPRHYFCFVNRSSGEPLGASIAGPGPAA